MKLLASIFVGHPLHILAVAVIFFAVYLALQGTVPRTRRHPGPSLIAFIAWTLYAAWEWLVLVNQKSPEHLRRMALLE